MPSMSRSTSRSLAFAGALASLLFAPLSRAQQDTRESEAKKACLANRPDRGIELLAELYAETNDPTYIYNQGRCYQQNGRGPDALVRFREYLRKATAIDPTEKASVERVIAELEQQEQARQSANAATPAASSAPAIAPAIGVTPAEPEPRADRRQLRIAGIAAAGLGAVALAGGIYMGLRTQQLSDEVSADAHRMMFSPSKYDEGTRAEILQWVGYGVGGLALATGAVLYVIGAGILSRDTTVAVTPSLGPREAGASVRIRF